MLSVSTEKEKGNDDGEILLFLYDYFMFQTLFEKSRVKVYQNPTLLHKTYKKAQAYFKFC